MKSSKLSGYNGDDFIDYIQKMYTYILAALAPMTSEALAPI